MYLTKRVKTLMQGGIKEITKVAQTFNEIDQLMEGHNLAGIEVSYQSLLLLLLLLLLFIIVVVIGN